MGEAKRRKASDPDYGNPIPTVPRLGDGGRGLVLSCPMHIGERGLTIKQSRLDRQELRMAALLWDHLVWPTSRAISFSGDQDAGFLAQERVLSRPEYTFSGNIAQGMASTFIQAYTDLEKREPGRWALAQGETSLMIDSRLVARDRGVLVELHRAIPIPDVDVPLAEVMEFRRKRRSELDALRAELDDCYCLIDCSSDRDFVAATQLKKVEARCVDMILLARENFPFRMTT